MKLTTTSFNEERYESFYGEIKIAPGGCCSCTWCCCCCCCFSGWNSIPADVKFSKDDEEL